MNPLYPTVVNAVLTAASAVLLIKAREAERNAKTFYNNARWLEAEIRNTVNRESERLRDTTDRLIKKFGRELGMAETGALTNIKEEARKSLKELRDVRKGIDEALRRAEETEKRVKDALTELHGKTESLTYRIGDLYIAMARMEKDINTLNGIIYDVASRLDELTGGKNEGKDTGKAPADALGEVERRR